MTTIHVTASRDYDVLVQPGLLDDAGAQIARRCCDLAETRTPDKPRFVIGVLGPTSRTASISPDVNDPGFRNTSFDELRGTYREAIEGLIDGGASQARPRALKASCHCFR